MSNLVNDVFARLDERKDEIIDIRRHLHENPEVSFEEENTKNFIADFYESKDVDVRTGVGGNGVVVTIDSGNPGKTIGIRADFDALPIQEDTGLEYASKNDGAMHACGHDGHTAYIMVLADTLIEFKDQLKGKIVVLHQHAEEVAPGGAKSMIEDGALDGVDNVFGIHVMSNMESGTINYYPGNIQTGRASFKVEFKGQGGHASSPHTANDAIVAASEFVVSTQSIISRNLNPFDVGSITIGNYDGRGANNAINGTVKIGGDVRAMTEEVRTEIIPTQLENRLKGVKEMYGVDYEFEYAPDYPVLHNDEDLTNWMADVLKETDIPESKGVQETTPQPPSEDFAYYAKERPSSFFYVGAAPKEGKAYPHHHPKFKIDEDSLIVCAKAMATIVVNYLETDQEFK